MQRFICGFLQNRRVAAAQGSLWDILYFTKEILNFDIVQFSEFLTISQINTVRRQNCYARSDKTILVKRLSQQTIAHGWLNCRDRWDKF